MSMKKDKIAGIIQKEVSEIIQFELKDPKIGFITITDVIVSGDLSIAKVYVSFLGQEARKDSSHGVMNQNSVLCKSNKCA